MQHVTRFAGSRGQPDARDGGRMLRRRWQAAVRPLGLRPRSAAQFVDRMLRKYQPVVRHLPRSSLVLRARAGSVSRESRVLVVQRVSPAPLLTHPLSLSVTLHVHTGRVQLVPLSPHTVLQPRPPLALPQGAVGGMRHAGLVVAMGLSQERAYRHQEGTPGASRVAHGAFHSLVHRTQQTQRQSTRLVERRVRLGPVQHQEHPVLRVLGHGLEAPRTASDLRQRAEPVHSRAVRFQVLGSLRLAGGAPDGALRLWSMRWGQPEARGAYQSGFFAHGLAQSCSAGHRGGNATWGERQWGLSLSRAPYARASRWVDEHAFRGSAGRVENPALVRGGMGGRREVSVVHMPLTVGATGQSPLRNRDLARAQDVRHGHLGVSLPAADVRLHRAGGAQPVGQAASHGVRRGATALRLFGPGHATVPGHQTRRALSGISPLPVSRSAVTPAPDFRPVHRVHTVPFLGFRAVSSERVGHSPGRYTHTVLASSMPPTRTTGAWTGALEAQGAPTGSRVVLRQPQNHGGERWQRLTHAPLVDSRIGGVFPRPAAARLWSRAEPSPVRRAMAAMSQAPQRGVSREQYSGRPAPWPTAAALREALPRRFGPGLAVLPQRDWGREARTTGGSAIARSGGAPPSLVHRAAAAGAPRWRVARSGGAPSSLAPAPMTLSLPATVFTAPSAAARSSVSLTWRAPAALPSPAAVQAPVSPSVAGASRQGSAAPGGTAAAPPLDLQRLTEQVYTMLERKLRIERTRRGL